MSGSARTQVLIIDDDPSILRTLVRLLARYDMDVETAEELPSALELIEGAVSGLLAPKSPFRLPDDPNVTLRMQCVTRTRAKFLPNSPRGT